MIAIKNSFASIAGTALLLLGASAALNAQNWSATLAVDPMPTPFVGDWQTDLSLASIEIENKTSKPDVVVVTLDLSRGNEPVFRGRSQRLLVNPGLPLLMNATSQRTWVPEKVSDALKQQVTRSGMMPEGDYQACVSVKNLWGTVLVGPVCAYFTIVHAEPPELVSPMNNEEVITPTCRSVTGLNSRLPVVHVAVGEAGVATGRPLASTQRGFTSRSTSSGTGRIRSSCLSAMLSELSITKRRSSLLAVDCPPLQ